MCALHGLLEREDSARSETNAAGSKTLDTTTNASDLFDSSSDGMEVKKIAQTYSQHKPEPEVGTHKFIRAGSSRLPRGGIEHVLHSRKRAMQTIAFICGGWATLIATCIGFKVYAMRASLYAPDQVAEYVKKNPMASNQWFTFVGVFLGEIALILWGHSISYMAFRRLAYGKERTELLTYAAWNEMGRAGYTLSRRKPLWPICTIIIFFANTFLPAGFSTLISPAQVTYTSPYSGFELDQLSTGFAAAISFMPASTFPNPANLSCGSKFVSNFWTFKSNPSILFDPCPSLDDFQTLILAGRAKLEASVNESDPLFRLPGSLTYIGGTGGTASLGPMALFPWGAWKMPPKRSPKPKGYNYTYVLNQQGLTVDVHCWQPKKKHEMNMLHVHTTSVPHLQRVKLHCSKHDNDLDADISYHYVGSSSILVKACSGKNAERDDDPDTTVMYFKDAGAFIYGTQGSELGGDLLCELKPKWTRNLVQYVSERNWIRVTELDDAHGVPDRLTGYFGELGPGENAFIPTSEQSKQDFPLYYARLLTVQSPLAAVVNAFEYSNTLSAVIDRTKTNRHAMIADRDVTIVDKKATRVSDVDDLRGSVLFGKNSAIQSLAAFNARERSSKARTWIRPSQVEVFIKGMFEYAATSQREWFQRYLVDGGDFNGTLSVKNGTVKVIGTWRQNTVGWGVSESNSNAFVFLSLIPLICFAIVSVAFVAWSHWSDAPQGEHPYAPEIDPTDWLDAVVASSQGGLRHAFPQDVLATKRGRWDARAIRVRLGQIFDDDEETKRPRLGFVCVD